MADPQTLFDDHIKEAPRLPRFPGTTILAAGRKLDFEESLSAKIHSFDTEGGEGCHLDEPRIMTGPDFPWDVEDQLLQVLRTAFAGRGRVAIEDGEVSAMCYDIHFPSHLHLVVGPWLPAFEAAIKWSEDHRPDFPPRED